MSPLEVTIAPQVLVPTVAACLFSVVLIYVILFVLLRYVYSIEGELFVIRRSLLGSIPLGTYRIRLSDIVAVERCGLRSGGRRYLQRGAPFSTNGVLLTLRRRHMLHVGIRVTPGDPDAFLREIMARSGARELSHAGRW